MSYILKLLGPFMHYILIGSITIITILTFMLNRANVKYDNMVIEAATKIERSALNVANLEIAVAEQKASIETLLIEKGESRARIKQQNEYMAELQNSLNEERRKNESYKTRWSNVANKRPTLLARLANRATAKRVRFFSFATCRSDCNEDGNGANSSPAAEETGSNSGN